LGTIDNTNKQTKICQDVSCTTFGNVNFLPTINSNTPGAVPMSINDSGITGNAWGDQIGWINFTPTGAGVTVNPTTGVLSGKAYATVGGWINFSSTGQSVTLVDNGSGSDFQGYAWVSGAGGGWMKFDCSSASTCVKTDWRTIPNRNVPTTPVTPISGGGGGSSGGVIIYAQNTPSPVPGLTPVSETVSIPNNAPLAEPSKSDTKNLDLNTVPSENSEEPRFSPSDTDSNEGEYIQLFKNEKETSRSVEKPCWLCVLERFDTASPIQKSIIKYGFVPKSLEMRIVISNSKQGKDATVPEKSVDATSIIITMAGLWALSRLVMLRMLK
jgi:hypothetical protein